jgi:hypothetical protein
MLCAANKTPDAARGEFPTWNGNLFFCWLAHKMVARWLLRRCNLFKP